MRYSMMSYTIARHGPKVFDLDRMLRLAVELKMAGVDFVTLHGFSAAELKKRCEGYGLAVVCYTIPAGGLTSDRREEVERAKETLMRGVEDAAALGAPVIMVVTPGRDDVPRDEARRRYIEGIARCIEVAKPMNIRVTVENFPGKSSPFVTAEDFLAAAVQLPDLGLTFDSGNTAGGEDPADSFRRVAGRVAHAHFKDWVVLTARQAGGREMLNGLRYEPALIGEGILNHKAVLGAMGQSGYCGCINIEYEGPKDPYEATRAAVNYLRALEVELGV